MDDITPNPVGRPTIYDPKYCEEIIKWFTKYEPYREVEIKHVDNKSGREWTTYEDKANDLPTLAGFAHSLNISRDTLLEWATVKYPENYENESLRGQLKYPEFSGAYKRAKELQEDFLITNGLHNLYAQPFAIFAAKNIIGWKDRTDLTSGDEKVEGVLIYKPDKLPEMANDTSNPTNDNND